MALCALGLLACPAPPATPDAGVSPPPPTCDSPEDCVLAGFEGVCRQGVCRGDVACGADAECGLGESCQRGRCAFTGCTGDAQCASGRCRLESFACAECSESAHCPQDRPVCDTASNECVQCTSNAQCPAPGPAYCHPGTGGCVHCLEDTDCPNGLRCADGVCHGARLDERCSEGVACDVGLICVNVGNRSSCMQSCSLYFPECPEGELCLKLTLGSSGSLVFEHGVPLGVCYPPIDGLRQYRDACVRSATGHNCQPNLECVPESSTVSTCRAFCDPNASSCPSGELCHAFPGDYSGHQYGLCYPDNGYADPCIKDGDCLNGLVCTPRVDPSASWSVSNACQFAVGPAPALARCASVTDGGVTVPPDQVCASGTCRGDPDLGTNPFFCFGACETDADCAATGRKATCDAEFDFILNGQTVGVRGCRPTCEGPSDCAEYGAGYTCRTRLVAALSSARLQQMCGPTVGPKGLGEPCGQDGDCQSGVCARVDDRGVTRAGVCVHPCAGAADCTGADGGVPGAASGPLACEAIALLGAKGSDGVANTGDDRFVTARRCTGVACTSDADCGGARCVPEPSPSNPKGELVLRCRPPTAGNLEAGQSCFQDQECASGVCAELQPPSTGTGKTCLMPCVSGTSCPGSTTCRAQAARVRTANGTWQSFDACVP